jgi:hypothetical protein
MAQSTPVLDKTYLAAGDLSTKQFTAVKFSADYTVNTCGAAQPSIGIQQDIPAAAGRGCRVRHLGTSKAVAGAAFAANAKLGTDANGKLVTAATGTDCIAIACQAALALNDIVEVLVIPGGLVA